MAAGDQSRSAARQSRETGVPRGVRTAFSLALGAMAYGIASLAVLNFTSDASDDVFFPLLVFAGLFAAFLVFIWQFGRLAIRHSWAGLWVGLGGIAGAVVLAIASAPVDIEDADSDALRPAAAPPGRAGEAGGGNPSLGDQLCAELDAGLNALPRDEIEATAGVRCP